MASWLRAAIVLTVAAAVAADGNIAVQIDDKTGSFNLTVNSKMWYTSGPIQYTTGGVTKSTQTGTLSMSASSTSSGMDALGAFSSTTLEWDSGNFVTEFRSYPSAVVFEQRFPNGVKGISLSQTDPMSVRDQVSTSFPTLVPMMAEKVGFLAFSGDMTGSGYKYGTLGGNMTANGSNGGNCRITQKVETVASSGEGYSAWTRDADGVNFTQHAGDYCACDDKNGTPSCEHWAWHGDTASEMLCQAKCEDMKCDCFDYSDGAPSPSHTSLPGGVTGFGPTCLFTQDLQSSVVVSSFSQFMTASAKSMGDGGMQYGLQASVTDVPAGYALSFIVASSPNGGVNEAFEAWGDMLLKTYAKSREMTYRDYSLNYLGYSTDNGAFYYYQTEGHAAKRGPPYTPGKTYEETLIDVKAYAVQEGIPYKYVLLDSWWYYQGVGSGVTNWIGRPDIFPNGNDYLRNATGWPIMGHNRYWAIDNIYATQNGGDYNFIVETKNDTNDFHNFAWPTEQRFWNDLMYNSSKWGLFMYEQDWLDTEYDNVVHLNTDADAARTWLLQMGSAATDNHLTIQYCMSHCRHIMQSIEIPAVTNARASGDYHAGSDQWKPLGTTGIFAWSVAIAPTKDNYWSTDHQNGSAYGDHATISEPHNRLQAAVSTISKGPVAPSDKIGSSNAPLIMKSCAKDGRLLQGDKPAMVMDMLHVERAFAMSTKVTQTRSTPDTTFNPDKIKAQLSISTASSDDEIWVTNTVLDGNTFAVMLAAMLDEDRVISPEAQLGMKNFVAFEANTTETLVTSGSISLKACQSWDFQHWAFAPVLGNGLALVGEQDKWVPVSAARFSRLAWHGTVGGDVGMSVVATGAEGEAIHVSFLGPGSMKPVVVDCEIPRGGSALISVDFKSGAMTSACNQV